MTALAAPRALPAEKSKLSGTDHEAEEAALAAGKPLIGVAGPMLDGKLVAEAPEFVLAAGREAKVAVMIGATDRDHAQGSAASKDELFAIFGANAGEARKLYDPQGDQTLDELKQQVFCDKIHIEPARYLADEVARAGHPAYLYRFSYLAESERGKMKGVLHGFEISLSSIFRRKFSAIKRNRRRQEDGRIGQRLLGPTLAKTGDPERRQPAAMAVRHDPAVDKLINFTNNGVVVGPDPLKSRLDLWRKVWSQNQ